MNAIKNFVFNTIRRHSREVATIATITVVAVAAVRKFRAYQARKFRREYLEAKREHWYYLRNSPFLSKIHRRGGPIRNSLQITRERRDWPKMFLAHVKAILPRIRKIQEAKEARRLEKKKADEEALAEAKAEEKVAEIVKGEFVKDIPVTELVKRAEARKGKAPNPTEKAALVAKPVVERKVEAVEKPFETVTYFREPKSRQYKFTPYDKKNHTTSWGIVEDPRGASSFARFGNTSNDSITGTRIIEVAVDPSQLPSWIAPVAPHYLGKELGDYHYPPRAPIGYEGPKAHMYLGETTSLPRLYPGSMLRSGRINVPGAEIHVPVLVPTADVCLYELVPMVKVNGVGQILEKKMALDANGVPSVKALATSWLPLNKTSTWSGGIVVYVPLDARPSKVPEPGAMDGKFYSLTAEQIATSKKAWEKRGIDMALRASLKNSGVKSSESSSSSGAGTPVIRGPAPPKPEKKERKKATVVKTPVKSEAKPKPKTHPKIAQVPNNLTQLLEDEANEEKFLARRVDISIRRAKQGLLPVTFDVDLINEFVVGSSTPLPAKAVLKEFPACPKLATHPLV